MNKLSRLVALTALILVLASLTVYAVTTKRDMPSRVDPGSEFTVKLTFSDVAVAKPFTFEESLPKGTNLKTWELSGISEKRSDFSPGSKFRVKDNAYGWVVTPVGPVILTYTALAPATDGTLSFSTVYFDDKGPGQVPGTLVVGKEAPVAPSTPTPPVAQPAPAAPTQKTPAPAPATSKGSKAWLWVLLILVIAGVAWYAFFGRKKRR